MLTIDHFGDQSSSNKCLAQWFRIDLLCDSVCFKLPITDLEWFTYPLPPVSTCLGLVFNCLGISNHDEFIERAKNLRVTKLAVFGTSDGAFIDYVWLRKLSIDRGKYYKYCLKGGQVEHPGGQTPTKIQMLHNFRGRIYVEVRSREKITCHDFERFANRPFLGRCEDTLTGFEIRELVPETVKNLKDNEGYEFFAYIGSEFACWIPEEINRIRLKHLYLKKFQIPLMYSLDGLTRSFITCGAYYGTGSLVEIWRMLVKSGIDSIPYDSQSMLPIFWFDTSFLYRDERHS